MPYKNSKDIFNYIFNQYWFHVRDFCTKIYLSSTIIFFQAKPHFQRGVYEETYRQVVFYLFYN